MDDIDAMTALTISLPEKFDAVTTALETDELLHSKDRGHTPLTFDMMKNAIIAEDYKLRARDDSNALQDAHFASHTSGKHKQRPHKPTHQQSERGNTKHRKDSQKKCHYCGKPNHIMAECLKRISDEKSSSNSKKSKDNSSSGKGKEDAFIAECSEEVLFSSEVDSKSHFILDSGATSHICNVRGLFHTYSSLSGAKIRVGNKGFVEAIGKGDIEVKVSPHKSILLLDVLHAPGMARNLISVSTAAKCGVKVIFEGSEGLVMRGDKVLAKAKEVGNLYYIPILNKLPNIVGNESSSHIAKNQQIVTRIA